MFTRARRLFVEDFALLFPAFIDPSQGGQAISAPKTALPFAAAALDQRPGQP
jgi:hypothetical protein